MEKKWRVLPRADSEISKLYPGKHWLEIQLLFNRGVMDAREAESFFSTDYYGQLFDPYLFSGMEAAVSLIIKHIKEKDKICIFGDYDADGVTSSALLSEVLEMLKGDVSVYIPDRVSEGYGMNAKAVEEVAKNGTKLIITVDNGIRNKREIDLAKSLGVDVVVTDHHPAPLDKKDWPDCPIINPVVPDEAYPFKKLAGVGVAFKLASAVIAKAKLDDEVKQILTERLLDLVAIGTVADCVFLTGENRVLVKRGLEVLSAHRRPGCREICSVAGLIDTGRNLDSWNIGFQIAPRLNAAGRMDHANTAYELLRTRNADEARALALRLNDRNYDRQIVTDEIVTHIREELKGMSPDERIIIAASPSIAGKADLWNEGVVGLVAGRICEEFYLPTLVVTGNNGDVKGSGRSIEEFNIVKALEECADLLEKYGGHPAACGFSLKESNFTEFRKRIGEIAKRELSSRELAPSILLEAELELSKINEEVFEIVQKFSPFGQGNEQPKFASYEARVLDMVKMGASGQHIKLKLKNADSGIKQAIGFGQSEKRKDLRVGDIIDIAYTIDLNEFNGRREVQMRIVDIKIGNAEIGIRN